MKKAVFLDRDGTLIRFQFPITDKNDIELLPNAAEAVRLMNRAGYLVIMVTNQPVIAMNLCTEKELDEINQHLEFLLENRGAHLDGIYYCPHYDLPFENGREEFLCECFCRKPKPGLLLKAAEDFDIDLSSSFMVGDTKRDTDAGSAAGCKSVFVKSGAEKSVEGADTFDDIYDFALKAI